MWIGLALATQFFILTSPFWISDMYLVTWLPKLWRSLRQSAHSRSSSCLGFSGLRSQSSSSSNKAIEVAQLWSSKKKSKIKKNKKSFEKVLKKWKKFWKNDKGEQDTQIWAPKVTLFGVFWARNLKLAA